MVQNSVNPYLKTKIMTASPQELRLMLFDGAIKFCHQARAAMAAEQIEDGFNHLMRAQKIVLELSTSLNHEVDPKLTEKLGALYTYIYRLLVDANMQHRIEPLDEAVKLLEFERATWRLLMQKLAAETGRDGESPTDIAGAQQTAISTWSQSA